MTTEAAQALLEYARLCEEWHQAGLTHGGGGEFIRRHGLAPSVSVGAWLLELRRRALAMIDEPKRERDGQPTSSDVLHPRSA